MLFMGTLMDILDSIPLHNLKAASILTILQITTLVLWLRINQQEDSNLSSTKQLEVLVIILRAHHKC